jgi:alanine racemase
MPLRALARVDLGAISANCARLAALAPLCAVVKADGYGHGAVEAARAAQAGGAWWLAVATAGEAAELRAAGIGRPLLVMGALSPEELDMAVAAGADIVAWREEFIAALAGRARGGARASGEAARARAARASSPGDIGVHVKLDTGMGRLGTRDPDEATRVAELVAATPGLRLAGAMTHFATADDDPAFMAEQLGRFLPWADALASRHPGLIRHASNSAAALGNPIARLDMIRCGIAIYGMDPFHRDPAKHGLRPALELVSYVAEVKRARPGDSAGYGRRFIAERDTWLATIPVGYGDGMRRGLTNRADVLVGGRRVPVAGTVSMDNITVDLGPGEPPPVGTEAVLLGARGGERILAEDWAVALGTINYEITCGITPRVPREYGGAPAAAGGR